MLSNIRTGMKAWFVPAIGSAIRMDGTMDPLGPVEAELIDAYVGGRKVTCATVEECQKDDLAQGHIKHNDDGLKCADFVEWVDIAQLFDTEAAAREAIVKSLTELKGRVDAALAQYQRGATPELAQA